ncbi:MAG: asparagine synthase (glutamine-hydrolyzing) [Nitrospira sp.]|nr:asparagine synthase (glutamine-hydrolyzing) [Nitrospira sp.]
MCGIAGLLNLDAAPFLERLVVDRMASSLIHRGPDEEGSLVDGPVAFGFRRLRVIDLETGHQPVSNENETIWAMFNGEIYNFVELRAELQKLGHHFRTQSDTEVIVYAYEAYGIDFVQHLRGMFAIALWDRRKKRLILVRDRIGEKPLFWAVCNNQLAFASEIKAFLQWPRLTRDVDPEAVHHYLTFLYVPAPKSIFKNVNKLSPAHMLIASTDSQSVQVSRYWQVLPQPNRTKSRYYFVEGLRDLMTESVRMCLRSDVPLGAFLSGGIDSSAVVGLMSQGALTSSVKTFSMGFEDRQFDETHYARLVARAFGTDHTEEIVKPIEVDLLQRLVWFLDEPFADSSAIPTYQVSRLARKHVTVALSGDGGDELFAGYPRYQYARRLGWLARVPWSVTAGMSWICREGIALLSSRCNAAREKLRRLDKALHLSRASQPERMLGLLSYFNEEDKRALYAQDFAESLKRYSSLDIVAQRFAKFSDHNDPVAAFMARDLETNLADDGLVKVDRMSMANSLEVRCPFLDHKLVEFSSTIPSEMKLTWTSNKVILKEAMANVLPPQIIHRGKRGFAVPFGTWFKDGNLRTMLDDCLSPESVRRRGMFDLRGVEQLRVAILSQGNANNLDISTYQLWHRVWILLMFELWARQYIDLS